MSTVQVVSTAEDRAESEAFRETFDVGDGPDVLLVLLGEHTYADPAVDEAVRAAVAAGRGVLVTCLDRNAQSSRLPPLLRANVDSGYAEFYRRPLDAAELRGWLERAPARPDPVREVADAPTPDWMPADTWKH
jgi:hypothetical protein